MRPRALDLFCCAGGAGMGLHRAGFDVVGVDIRPQPRYPFEFHQADALTFPIDGFDFIWASPPCQAFTAYRRGRPGHVAERPNLIPQTRERLKNYGAPWAIENIPRAPLNNPIVLCGSMFGLDVRRHRLFELGFPAPLVPPCQHHLQLPRFKPSTNRRNLRKTIEVGSWDEPIELQRKAMGIDWMELLELTEAIPPAYSEYIGRAALGFIKSRPLVQAAE